jgi:hypothetical protein
MSAVLPSLSIFLCGLFLLLLLTPEQSHGVVFVEGGRKWKKYTSSQSRASGVGFRNIGKMMDDVTINYYFDTEAEMMAYSRKQTKGRNMGVIEWTPGNKVWIRLVDEIFGGKPILLGEVHTDKNGLDIVKATGVNKFRHEAFTEYQLPAWDQNSNRAEVAKAVEAHVAKLKAKYKVPASKYDQFGEDVLPKMWRVVAAFGTNLKPTSINWPETERKYFPIAVTYAAGIQDDAYSELVSMATSDPVVEFVADLAAVDARTGNYKYARFRKIPVAGRDEKTKAVIEFIDEFSLYCAAVLRLESKVSKADMALLQRRVKLNDYEAIAASEMYRDISMFEHMKKAIAAKYLLFIAGDTHRQRLEPVAMKLGMLAMTAEELITLMKGKYPQPSSKKAIDRT